MKYTKSNIGWILAGLATLSLAVTFGCTNGDSPTSPTLPTHTEVAAPAPAPAPAPPSPPPPEENTKGDNPGPLSITFNADGSGRLCNSATGAPHGAWLFYTKVLDESVRYIPDVLFTAPIGGCVNIPPAAEVMGNVLIPEVGCDPYDWSERVQIDATAGQGEHIGHVFVDVTLHQEAGEGTWVEQEPVYGEWIDASECLPADVEAATTERVCYGRKTQHRSKTVVYINSCTEKTREVVTRETQEVLCEYPDDPIGELIIERELVCNRDEVQSKGDKCWFDCELTITRTQNYTCSEPDVDVKTEPKREPTECPCEETGPTDVPQDDVLWLEEILQGRCETEVPPLDFEESTYSKCHQNGTQTIIEDMLCEEDTSRVRELCRNVRCPQTCQESRPAEGQYSFTSGGPAAECAAFGDFITLGKDEHRPWDLNTGLFYIIKGGNKIRVSHSKPGRYDRTVWIDWRQKDISHITVCACPQ
jgi:hypothetical protein